MIRHPLPVGFVLLFATGTALYLRPGAVTQPIAYNHSKHIAAGMDCTDCHAGARTAEHATLPPLATCMGCHENTLTQSAEEAKLRALSAAHREPGWVQVTHVPAHVYFSHRRHATLAAIKCAECHGAMEKLTAPPARPFRDFSMDACLACHQRGNVRSDCNDCHR